MRVLVIGRGVFGLSTALALAVRGHAVVVLGPRDGSAASEAVSRIVRNDYAADPFHQSWAEEAMAVWERWSAEADEPMLHRVGLVNLTAEPMRVRPYVRESYARVTGASRLDALSITTMLPFLTPGRFVDGYLNPAAGWVHASAALRHLESLCEGAGVGLIPERVASVGNGWVGLVDGGLLRADRVVVAAGAWTPGLVPETRQVLVPSGQPVLFLRPPDPTPFRSVPVWALDLETTGFYGFPAGDDGVVKVGHHGRGVTRRLEVRTVSDSVLGRFRDFFRMSVSALAGARVDSTRVCFYCDAPGGRFLVDVVPDRPSVVVAAGGSGHAFKFAPVLGEVVASVVLGEDHPRRASLAWRPPDERRDAARAGALDEPR